MNEGHAFSFAIKSFSSGKYLKVDGDVASDTLSVSFTGHFNACDTRIRELTSVLLLNVVVFSLDNSRHGSHEYLHKP